MGEARELLGFLIPGLAGFGVSYSVARAGRGFLLAVGCGVTASLSTQALLGLIDKLQGVT